MHFFAWCLMAGTFAFAIYVAHDQGFFLAMFLADRSHLSVFILIMFAGASLHAAWHIFQTSSRIEAARVHHDSGAVELPENDGPDAFKHASQFVQDFASQSQHAKAQKSDAAIVLEIYADRLRSAVEIGWYVVDILIRLGLIGTIVGFILILGALTQGPEPTGDNI